MNTSVSCVCTVCNDVTAGGELGAHHNMGTVQRGLRNWKYNCPSLCSVLVPNLTRSESPEVSSAPEIRSKHQEKDPDEFSATPKFKGFDAMTPETSQKNAADTDSKRRRLQDSTPRVADVPKIKPRVLNIHNILTCR